MIEKQTMRNAQHINLLNQLKDRLITNVPEVGVEKVILFGSQLTGTANEGSDYDILIIVKNDYDWKLARRIRAECYGLGIVYDFVPDVKILSRKEKQSLRGHQPFILAALKSEVYA